MSSHQSFDEDCIRKGKRSSITTTLHSLTERALPKDIHPLFGNLEYLCAEEARSKPFSALAINREVTPMLRHNPFELK